MLCSPESSRGDRLAESWVFLFLFFYCGASNSPDPQTHTGSRSHFHRWCPGICGSPLITYDKSWTNPRKYGGYTFGEWTEFAHSEILFGGLVIRSFCHLRGMQLASRGLWRPPPWCLQSWWCHSHHGTLDTKTTRLQRSAKRESEWGTGNLTSRRSDIITVESHVTRC